MSSANGQEVARRDELAPPDTQSTRGMSVSLDSSRRDLDQAFRLANALSQSNLLPEALRGKPSNVLVTMMYGQELGLGPMPSFQVIDVIKGRPSLRANLWVALARRAGHKVRKGEHTAESCTMTVIRHDDPDGPVTVTYTMADAEQAGLLSNENYRKNPKAMLYARAASTVVREACPEVAFGFSDEFEVHAFADDEPQPEQPRTLRRVDAQREQPPEPEQDSGQVAAQLAAMEAEHTAPAEQLHVPDDEPDPDAEPVAGVVVEDEPGDEEGLWPPVAAPGSKGQQ